MMGPEKLREIMESIEGGRINGCIGCWAWEIAESYKQICDPLFESAMLKLLEQGPEAQYPAYLVLCQCQDRLSERAIRQINAYKKDACHNRVLRRAKKEYGISPEAIPEKSK